MQDDYAIVVEKRPVTQQWDGRGGFLPIAIVEHMMQGTLEETWRYFNGTAEDAGLISAHYGVGRDGRVWQFVADENTAWANGLLQSPDTTIPWLKEVYEEQVNCNLVTLAVQYEGFSGEPLTEVQYEAALALHRELVKRWEIEADSDHIIGHNRLDGEERADNPGAAFPWLRLLRDLMDTRPASVSEDTIEAVAQVPDLVPVAIPAPVEQVAETFAEPAEFTIPPVETTELSFADEIFAVPDAAEVVVPASPSPAEQRGETFEIPSFSNSAAVTLPDLGELPDFDEAAPAQPFSLDFPDETSASDFSVTPSFDFAEAAAPAFFTGETPDFKSDVAEEVAPHEAVQAIPNFSFAEEVAPPDFLKEASLNQDAPFDFASPAPGEPLKNFLFDDFEASLPSFATNASAQEVSALPDFLSALPELPDRSEAAQTLPDFMTEWPDPQEKQLEAMPLPDFLNELPPLDENSQPAQPLAAFLDNLPPLSEAAQTSEHEPEIGQSLSAALDNLPELEPKSETGYPFEVASEATSAPNFDYPFEISTTGEAAATSTSNYPFELEPAPAIGSIDEPVSHYPFELPTEKPLPRPSATDESLPGAFALPDWLQTAPAPATAPPIEPSASLPDWLQASPPAPPVPPPPAFEVKTTKADLVPAVSRPNQGWQENLFDGEDLFASAAPNPAIAASESAQQMEQDSELGLPEPTASDIANFERMMAESGATIPPALQVSPEPASADNPITNADRELDFLFEEEPLPPSSPVRPRSSNFGATAPLFDDIDMNVPDDLDLELFAPLAPEEQAKSKPTSFFEPSELTPPPPTEPTSPPKPVTRPLSGATMELNETDFATLAPFPPPGRLTEPELEEAPPARLDTAATGPINWASLGGGVISVELANVRLRPSYEEDTILRVAELGQRFHFDGWSEGPPLRGSTRWYHLTQTDGGGWIHSSLVQLDRPFNP